MRPERLMDLCARRTQQAEAYVVEYEQTMVQFHDSRLKGIETSRRRLAALRVVVEGRVGFSTSTREDDEETLVNNACELARHGQEVSFDFPGPREVEGLPLVSREVVNLPLDEMVQMGTRFVDSLREGCPKATGMAMISKLVGKVRLVNSAGFDEEYQKTVFTYFCGARVVEEGNFLTVFRMTTGTDLEARLDRLNREVLEDLRLAQRNVPLPAGNYPAIIHPRALPDLLRPLLASVNGQAVEKGVSPWRDRLGERLLDERFTLWDRPRAAELARSAPFDDEGIPTQDRPIIEAGVLKCFLLDLRTAAALGMPPSGNGWRQQPSAESLPSPGPSNLVLEPGEEALAEMIAGTKRGVLVKSLMGAWAGNPYSGQVSGNVDLGILIEDGQPVGRVKDCMFATNVFEAFRDHLEALSRETEITRSGRLPYVKLATASFSTRN